MSNAPCANLKLISNHIKKHGLESCNRQFSIFCCIMRLIESKKNYEKNVKLNANSPVISESHIVESGRWQGVDPNLWNENFANECSKFSQSPINIVTSETVYDKNLKNFVFKNLDKEFKWKMLFDGFTS